MGAWKEKKLARLGETFGDLTLEAVTEGVEYQVRCECGVLFNARRDQIVKFGWTDCGCAGVRAGDTLGSFTIISPVGVDTRKRRARVVVRCACGKSDTTSVNAWLRGEKPHGCWAGADMVGKTFGRLTVVSYAYSGRDNNRFWDCTCACGNVVQAATVDLRRGNTRSCGCLQREVATARAKARFPRTETPTYVTAHRWIWDTNGPAAEHECVQCGDQAQDWAYDGADPLEVIAQFTHRGLAYSLNPDHYKPMCKSCHGAFDAELRRDRKSVAEADRVLKARIELFGADRVAEQDAEALV